MAEVVHDLHRNRLVVADDGEAAELTYRRRANRMILVHTEVPEAMGGHGVGGALVRAALQLARDEGLTVVPLCPFAAGWLADHPDVASTVAVEWPA